MDNLKRLSVKYNNDIVGYLELFDNDQIGFQYSIEWLENGFSISPFSLPLIDKVFISTSSYFKGLFGVFNDNLPDGWGEYILRRYLMLKKINFDKLNPLVRLSILNTSSLGGLTFEPVQMQDQLQHLTDLDEISVIINQELNNKTHTDLDSLYQLGGASGGARPKVHLNFEGDAWIIKFPALNEPTNYGLLEFNANALAKECGININEHKLFPSKLSEGFFGAKRFDRVGEKKVHVISLAAILETTHRIPNLDYKHLLQVVQEISIDQEDQYEVYRRMVFNVLYGNKDDHSKNHAFIYDDIHKGYRLSPAFDITKTTTLAEHQLTVLGNGNPNIDDLLMFADVMKLSLKRCKEIIFEITNKLI